MKHNPNNERVKRQYLEFLEQAKQQNETSVDAVAMALTRFEEYAKRRDFKQFHYQQAIGFKKHLAQQKNQQTGKPLSKATLHSTLRHIKAFFEWLSQQPGYKSRLSYTDMEYFNLSEKDTRIATARREQAVATLEQIIYVLDHMPNESVIEKRDRALIAFTILSGARDAAIASMKLKHVDITNDRVIQDAREVNTKFSKTFTSDFFPVGDSIRVIVVDWINYLRSELLFGNEDPLFPKTKLIQNKKRVFEASGVHAECWANAGSIRKIFKQSFEAAGLPYFQPHSFRKTLAGLGEQVCKTPEEFKAWSQNLGHDHVLTTFTSYGEVQPQRQTEIFKRLKDPDTATVAELDLTSLAKGIAAEMAKCKL